MINIELMLEDLKDGKSPRTKQNIDKLNDILRSYAEAKHKDFSITQIGRVSAAEGGPGYEAIRATRNKHYRDLIEVWAQKCNTSTKSPLGVHSRSKTVPADNKLLELIPDLAVRALFGQIVAERNRYRKEVNLLKQHANITIDKRPVRHFSTSSEPSVEVLPSFLGVLTESEKKALSYAVSDDCMERNNWQYTQAGQVKDIESNQEILPRGFITGLRKVLGEVDE